MARDWPEPEDADDPEAWADVVEDAGLMDRLPLNRRKFLGLAHGFGGAAALSALAGCSGGDGGDGGDGGSTTTASGDGGSTTTPEETQQDRQTPAGELEVVKISTVPVSSTLPIYVAQEEGFFEERGIKTELTATVSGSKATAQLATGQLDGTGGATGASTLNAIAQGIGIQAVTDRLHILPDRQSALEFLAADGVYEEGMTLADMGGMTWATNTTASVGHYHIGRALQAHGLTFDDIEFTTLPFPQMVSALQSGSVDMVQEVGALASVARNNANAHHLEWTTATTPECQVAMYQFGEPFINQRPETAVRWIEGYLLGVRKMYEYGPFSQEVIDIWTEYADSSPAALKGGIPPWAHANGGIAAEDLERQQDFFSCMGQMESKVNMDDFVNTELLDEALSTIGTADRDFPSLETWEEWQGMVEVDFPAHGENHPPETTTCGGAGSMAQQ